MRIGLHRSHTSMAENIAKIIKASETLSFLDIDDHMSKSLSGSASEYWDNIVKGGEIIRYDVKEEHNIYTTRTTTMDRTPSVDREKVFFYFFQYKKNFFLFPPPPKKNLKNCQKSRPFFCQKKPIFHDQKFGREK